MEGKTMEGTNGNIILRKKSYWLWSEQFSRGWLQYVMEERKTERKKERKNKFRILLDCITYKFRGKSPSMVSYLMARTLLS